MERIDIFVFLTENPVSSTQLEVLNDAISAWPNFPILELGCDWKSSQTLERKLVVALFFCCFSF